MAVNGIDTISIASYVEVLVDVASTPTIPVEDVQSIGEISDEATIVDVSAYGQQYLRKLVGSKSAGPMEIVVNAIFDVVVAPQQQMLRDAYRDGTSLFFTVEMKNAAGDAGDFVSFQGLVASASISNEFDGIRSQTFSIVISGAVSDVAPIDFPTV
jgi:hypothetical protein